jgi:hypothetical protein
MICGGVFVRRAHLPFALALSAFPAIARAQLLDGLLPSAVPGYAQPGNWLATRREDAPGATGWRFGGLNLAPGLAAQSGYDSAPNGSAGSTLLGISPDFLVADPVAGFGAYAEVNETAYPQNAAQNLFSAALAGGERLQLPREVLTFSGAFLRAAETGFALNSFAIAKPVAFTLKDVRASDEITDGRLTVTPRLSASFYDFPDLPSQNRQDLRAGLTMHYDNGAPLSYVAALRAGRSTGTDETQDAGNYAALAGLQDKADGLWTVSVLAGGAWRAPRTGLGLTAPVMEARLDWSPDRLDELHLNLAREIDDPDRLSATPYTLTQAKFTFIRADLNDITATATADISNAAYIHNPLRETLFSGSAELKWHMSPALAVDGRYLFNDRQSNQLGAANEYVLTLGVSWTP